MSVNRTNSSVIGLDIGTVRIGVAKAYWPDGIPTPYTTLANDDSLIANLKQIIDSENVSLLVIGLPRNMNSQSTKQTDYVKRFAKGLSKTTGLPVRFQDEAVTSIRAEEELRARGKAYDKGDIDKLSASYILDDYLHADRREGFPLEHKSI